GDSKMLKHPSSATHTPVATTARGKTFDAEAAAAQAAAMLAALGGGPITAGGPATATATTKIVKNSVGMAFVRVPPGTFVMGSPDDEQGRREYEGPAHEVEVGRRFYLAVNPVTQSQYERVMGRNPSKFTRPRGGGPDHPIECVSWKEAEAFCLR